MLDRMPVVFQSEILLQVNSENRHQWPFGPSATMSLSIYKPKMNGANLISSIQNFQYQLYIVGLD